MTTNTVRHNLFVASVVLAIAVSGFCTLWSPALMSPVAGTTAEAAALEVLNAPLSFEPSQGQAPDSARFLSRGPGYALWLEPDCVQLQLGRAGERPTAISMHWIGGRADAPLKALEPLDGTVSHMNGRDRSRWLRDLPTYRKVRYQAIYPGIDLEFYGNPQRLEYDLVLAAGANPADVQLEFGGVDAIAVEASSGDLLLHLGRRTVRQHAPVAYQEVDGRRAAVPAAYVINGHIVSFVMGTYEAARPLVIDPVMDWSTFLGGSDTPQLLLIKK